MTQNTVCSEFYHVINSDLLGMRLASHILFVYCTQPMNIIMQVHMEDQAIFVSEETEGQYIHTSSKTYHQVGITLHRHW